MDQQRSEIRVASLADAHQPGLAAAGVLSRHQPQPRGKLPPVGKSLSIADGGDNRSCNERPYALDCPNTLTVFMALKGQLDPPIGDVDLLFQLREFFVEATE